MDENIKKEKLEKLNEELSMLQKISDPFLKKMEQVKRDISFYQRLKKINDIVEWEDHFGTHSRETDYYSGKIIEIDLEKKCYKVIITKHSGDSVKYGYSSREIGTIVTRGI